MAVGHALSGACAGLYAGAALGAPPAVTLAIGGAMAGAVLAPDFDHPGSTASTAFGPLSKLVHYGVVGLHHLTVDALRGPDDMRDPGPHRGITHWWPCPIVAGVAVWAACLASTWSVTVILAVLFTLAIRGVSVPEYREKKGQSRRRRFAVRTAYRLAGEVETIAALRWLRRTVGHIGKLGVAAIASGLAYAATEWGGASVLGPWMGDLVAAGIVLHILGDAPTESGVPGPSLFTELRLPKWLAFKAGGWFEVAAIWVPLSVVAFLLIPGVWPTVLPLVIHASHAAAM